MRAVGDGAVFLLLIVIFRIRKDRVIVRHIAVNDRFVDIGVAEDRLAVVEHIGGIVPLVGEVGRSLELLFRKQSVAPADLHEAVPENLLETVKHLYVRHLP